MGVCEKKFHVKQWRTETYVQSQTRNAVATIPNPGAPGLRLPPDRGKTTYRFKLDRLPVREWAAASIGGSDVNSVRERACRKVGRIGVDILLGTAG
jgi:hypothetical protein